MGSSSCTGSRPVVRRAPTASTSRASPGCRARSPSAPRSCCAISKRLAMPLRGVRERRSRALLGRRSSNRRVNGEHAPRPDRGRPERRAGRDCLARSRQHNAARGAELPLRVPAATPRVRRPAGARATAREEVRGAMAAANPLVGAWRLVSMEHQDEWARAPSLRGRASWLDHLHRRWPDVRRADGAGVARRSGWATVPARASPRRPRPSTATCSYAGRYEFLGDRVVHHIEIALIPDWVGRTLERLVDLDGARLILSTLSTTRGRKR